MASQEDSSLFVRFWNMFLTPFNYLSREGISKLAEWGCFYGNAVIFLCTEYTRKQQFLNTIKMVKETEKLKVAKNCVLVKNF